MLVARSQLRLLKVRQVEKAGKTWTHEEGCLRKLSRVSVRLAELSIQLPRSVRIAGVILLGEQPCGGGSFADIYKGRYGDKLVAVKKLRMTVYQSKDSWVGVARVRRSP